MKFSLALAIILLLAISLQIGCSSSDPGSDTTPSTDETANVDPGVLSNPSSTQTDSPGSNSEPATITNVPEEKSYPFPVVRESKDIPLPEKYSGLEVRYLSVSPNGKLLVAVLGTPPGTAEPRKATLLIDLVSHEVLVELPDFFNHRNQLGLVRFRKDGKQILGTNQDGQMQIVSLPSGESTTVDFPVRPNWNLEIGYSEDQMLAFRMIKGQIDLVNTNEGTLVGTVPFPESETDDEFSVRMKEDVVIISRRDGTLFKWQVGTEPPVQIGQLEVGTYEGFDVWPTGDPNKYVVHTGENCYIYNAQSGEKSERVNMMYGMNICSGSIGFGYQGDCFFGNAHLLDSGDMGPGVYKITEGKVELKAFYPVQNAKNFGGAGVAKSISADGKTLVVSEGAGPIRVFDTAEVN